MVLHLLLVLILHIHSGLSGNYSFQDTILNGSTHLEIIYNKSGELNNIPIGNLTAETYELLDRRPSISQNFLLPSMEQLIITNSTVSELIIADWNKEETFVTSKVVVRNTSIRSLPKGIDKLVQLKEIRWNGNELDTLNLGAFSGMKHLIGIVFSECSLREVTDSGLVLLPSLSSLVLAFNQISHIDTERWIMPKLITLNLRNNQLIELPRLKQFYKLYALHVQHNLISNVNPTDFSELNSLSNLNLNNNRISHLDATNFIHLPRLRLLVLDRNHLRSLDVSKWDFPELILFSVEHNQLRTIEGFGSISKRLRTFRSNGNPWDCEWVHFAMVDLKEPVQREWAKGCVSNNGGRYEFEIVKTDFSVVV